MKWDIDEIITKLKEWRCSDYENVIYTTNGCFDILHCGHIRLIKAMRDDIIRNNIRWIHSQIVIGINSDRSVRKLKGKGRPIIRQNQRAEIIYALYGVDKVFIFDDDTPEKWIGELKPNKHFKAGYKIEDVPEAEIIKSYGGQLILLDKLDDISTTQIIERIKHELE